MQQAQKPRPNVKCVAWDLENTLWKGILAEDGDTRLEGNVAVRKLIRALDNRRVSKNRFQDAWRVIERLGLQDYLLQPAVNWQPQSQNLAERKLKINLDTFAHR